MCLEFDYNIYVDMSAGYKTRKEELEEVREPHRINKVLITGNGFDVALGYKTTYKNFISFIKEYKTGKYDFNGEFEEIIKTNHFINYFLNRDFDTWNNFESEIGKIIVGIKELFDNNPVVVKMTKDLPGRFEPLINVNNDLVKNILKLFNIIDFSANDTWVMKTYFQDEVLLNKIENELEKELDDFNRAFTMYLNSYLKEYSKGTIESRDKVSLKVIKSIAPDYIMTFNYTEVYKDVFDNAYARHLHGNAMEDMIVLGYEEEGNDYRFAKFRKSFQRLYKQVFPISSTQAFSEFDRVSSDQMENGEMILKENLIFFYGFSFDEYDSYYVKYVLSVLGEKGKIIIYYHSENSKRQIIINLLRIMDHDEFYNCYLKSKIVFLKTDVLFDMDRYLHGTITRNIDK